MEKKDLLANYAASKQNMCITNDTISDGLFQEYGVNRGLRDVNGKGVLTGLTRISKIVSFKDENGKQVPCDGELWYRGYNVKTLIKSIGPNEFGFEKAAYLLLLENFRIRRSWMNSVRCSATAGHFRPILPETLL